MKISLVNGICVKHDAISESLRGTFGALNNISEVKCRLFTYSCEFPEIDTEIVSEIDEMIFDDHFLSSDLIIYHFGIYYPLFNGILLGNGRASQVVRFHNVTPKEFISPQEHFLIDKSIRQIANMDAATQIWADSSFNKEILVEYGLPAKKIDVSPLYVKSIFSRTVTRSEKSTDYVRILFVGRFVRSKGVTDLIEAVAAIREQTNIQFKVELVGNVQFSDQTYLSLLRELIKKKKLEDFVQLLGQVDDEALSRKFIQSHLFVLPSYHEGFCVPLIEALKAHCVPIAYAAGNVIDLLTGIGEVVELGNITKLSDRLLQHIKFFNRFNSKSDPDSMLPLRSGPMKISQFDASIEARLSQYSFSAFRHRLLNAIDDLTGSSFTN
jgi:glycosyltransferase involved in cell wall biosynthesis